MYTRPDAGEEGSGQVKGRSSTDVGVISGVRQLQGWSAHGDAPSDRAEDVRFRLRSTEGVAEFTGTRKGQLKLQR